MIRARYHEAIEAYDEAIRINPDYANVWYNKALGLEALGRNADASIA